MVFNYPFLHIDSPGICIGKEIANVKGDWLPILNMFCLVLPLDMKMLSFASSLTYVKMLTLSFRLTKLSKLWMKTFT